MRTILCQPFLILILILLRANLLTAQSTGLPSLISPVTNNHYGVHYNEKDTMVAVDELGTRLRSTDGGHSWSIISSPVGDELRAVSFLGDTGLAVGILDRILRKQMPESHRRCFMGRYKKICTPVL